jgi:KipI family sensor histidine kinase inhibitor
LLVEYGSLQEVRDNYAEARRRQAAGRLPSTIELVPGARTILFDELDNPAALALDLPTWRPAPASTVDTREIEIPTVYNGADLADVAELWGVSPAAVIERHTGLSHEVAFIGFAPGFAYLAGLPEPWSVPRRAQPRPRVPAGSVALAGQFTGVYPRESPGGWQLIGRTNLPLWDPTATRPALLLPGDRVRFIAIPG